MAMVVTVVNVTDAPESKKTPTRLAIYTTHLDPGEELKLPASMVDARLRKLESDGYIVIGQLPSWYQASKSRKLGRRVLTPDELVKQLVKPKAVSPKKEEGELLGENEPRFTRRSKFTDDTVESKKSDKK